MKLDKLQVEYILPTDDQLPGERFIKAIVSDGEHMQTIKFGRHTPMKTVISQIPIIFSHNLTCNSKKKAV
jgi:hypothetical protein